MAPLLSSIAHSMALCSWPPIGFPARERGPANENGSKSENENYAVYLRIFKMKIGFVPRLPWKWKWWGETPAIENENWNANIEKNVGKKGKNFPLQEIWWNGIIGGHIPPYLPMRPDHANCQPFCPIEAFMQQNTTSVGVKVGLCYEKTGSCVWFSWYQCDITKVSKRYNGAQCHTI